MSFERFDTAGLENREIAEVEAKRIEGYRNLPMTSFFYFIKGDPTLADPTRGDPAGSTQFYNYMRGRVGLTGQPFLNPDGNPTSFVLPGDPISGSGWIDGQQYPADDRRMGLSSGPFTMAPGDTQEVVVAEICAGAVPGVDRLTAVGLLKFFDKAAQLAYENGFKLPSPPPAPKAARAARPLERTQEQPLAAASSADQVGAEGEIYDPPFFRNPLRGAGGSSGFGPMASNDFGADLDIPTVIRNLSD